MFKDILFPVDIGHQDSWRRSLPIAVTLCRVTGANLHVLAVLPQFGPAVVSQYFPENFEDVATTHMMEDLHGFTRTHLPTDIKVQHIIAHGRIYDEILRTAEAISCDLIVMGAHRPDLTDYLIGTNAAKVVRHAKCSVLIARD